MVNVLNRIQGHGLTKCITARPEVVKHGGAYLLLFFFFWVHNRDQSSKEERN